MKTFVVLISISLVTSFSLIYAFAQELPEHMRRDTETTQIKSERKPNRDTEESTPDANSIVDPNDPNATKAPYQMSEELEFELEFLNQDAEKETREWMRSKTDDRTNLAKYVNEQIVREFNFIREFAVEEGAVKTTAAIDGLMMMRKERFDRLAENLEDIKNRLKKREERREGRDRDRGERRRERTTRRREL